MMYPSLRSLGFNIIYQKNCILHLLLVIVSGLQTRFDIFSSGDDLVLKGSVGRHTTRNWLDKVT